MYAAMTALVACAAVSMQAQPLADPMIVAAREAADAFAQSSPDYIVKRTTTRYQRHRPNSWRVRDTVTADVTAERRTETYANIRVNGRPAKNLPSDGTWSDGEFSTMLVGILSPKSAALFTNRRPDPIRNRPSYRYDFSVDQEHSGWRMEAAHVPGTSSVLRVSPAYSGSIWIDTQTGQTLRFEMSGRDVPVGFPLETVETAVDYDFVQVGNREYLLPAHSETVTCARAGNECYRNVTVFEEYRKFGADTSISFGDGAK
jgi:hypothetical protein